MILLATVIPLIRHRQSAGAKQNLTGLEVEFLGLWSTLNLDEPILEKYLSIMGKQIDFEIYTTAGIHKHQVENEGYGLITSDEGHRDIQSCATVLWNH